MKGFEKYAPFLSLLSIAMDGPRVDIRFTEGQWRDIYATACRQSVQGLLLDAVKTLPQGSGIGKGLLAEWLIAERGLEESYQKHSAIVAKQRGTWEKHGVDAVLLKGLTSAAFYPVPSHRVLGDIDWWMKTDRDWDNALEVLSSNGLAWEHDSDGDIHYELAGVVVEHHHDGLVEDGPVGELFLRNEHVLHHAMVMGVGMRQICDYAFALRSLEGQYDRDEYENVLRREGILKWTLVLEELVRGLQAGTCPESLSKKARRLLVLVMEDGNMGLDKPNRFSGFFPRATLFLGLCPGKFIGRWCSLAVGRVKRKRK